MGLTPQRRRALAGAITLVLFATAFVADRWWPRPDWGRDLAARYIEDPVAVRVRGGAAFRAGDRAVLPFDVAGQQARIRGAVIVTGNEIERVVVVDSNEGVDRRALGDRAFLGAFSGRSVERTVVVDAVSGATISSFTLMRAVNDRLRAWREVSR